MSTILPRPSLDISNDQSEGNIYHRRSQHPKQATTVRGVRQDKIAPQRYRIASIQSASHKKMARPHHLDTIISRPQNYSKKRSNKRQTLPITIWANSSEKKELQRIAESEGLSTSRTGRAILVDGIRQRLRLEREALATPAIEAAIDKKMNRLINNLSEFLGRSVYEGGQMRWLFINMLYREVIHPDKKLTKEEFYKLLDTSQKETIKAMKGWNPNIKDLVEAIKKRLRESEEEQK